MVLHTRGELADRVIAAAKERGVLLPEWLKAAVRTNGRPDVGGGEGVAAQCGAEGFEAFRLLPDGLPLAKIDPGQELQEPGRWRFAARHQHRDHRKFLVTALPNQCEFTLVLLGVANTVAADEDRDRLGAADCVFEGRDPPEASAKRAAVEKG